MMRRAIAAVMLVTMAGCSTLYTPRGRGVAMVMKGGKLFYARDGKLHEQSIFGDGLEDSVRGNPAAEQAARTFQDKTSTGFLLALGGLLCSEIAVLYSLNQYGEDPDYEMDTKVAAVAIGCGVVAVIGMTYLFQAAPYQWDAINIYNDGIDAAVVAPYPPPARREVRPRLPQPDNSSP